MKRGFTILELLVAAILLAMLMSILTMIFSQSSVAWRIGTDSVMNLGKYRNEKGYWNEKADVSFVYDDRVYELRSPFNNGIDEGTKTGSLRSDRPVKTGGEGEFKTAYRDGWHSHMSSSADTSGRANAYIVNVMSGGPNNDVMDWKAIWSYPDDFD